MFYTPLRKFYARKVKRVDFTYNVFMLRLKELRLARELTQSELADALHISRDCISNWECSRSLPDINDLMLLATYFDVTIDYLVGFVDEFGNKSDK